MTNNVALTSINQRVWVVEAGVHPAHSPEFLSLGKVADDPSVTIGEDKRISAPDPNSFGRDIQVGTVQGETERAKLSLAVRYTVQKARLLELKNKRCRLDVFVLSGKCGWQTVQAVPARLPVAQAVQ